VSPPRFFVDAPLAADAPVRLPAKVAHHAQRVLRLRDGASIVLFDGRGGEYAARLRAEGSVALAQVEAFDPIERESPLHLTLVQALVAADKLDWIVEKAVELGVARVLVVPMQRSVVRLDAARAARRAQHWVEVARAACCQCGRNRVPAVEYFGGVDDALTALPAEAARLLPLPAAERSLGSAVAGDRAVLMIGPEGGLAENEVTQAVRAGFVGVHLGPRVLRTETAGLAALAALQAMNGDLGCDGAGSPPTRR
jgi:16S rRNA (uracil1498-N3)-methyltransferase